MTHYNDNPGMVRVDYFKPGGKWYMTEAIEMPDAEYSAPNIHEAVRRSLDASRPDREPGWWSQFTVVVLEPYHQHAHPVMIVAVDS